MNAIDFSRATDKGLRENNQDAFFITDDAQNIKLGKLFVVTDGVGGNVRGDWAAQVAAKTIHDTFYHQRQAGVDIAPALLAGFVEANRVIHNKAQADGVRMSCTAVAAAVFQKQLYVAHVGDARAYLLATDHKLHQLTADHTWVAEQMRHGVITITEAENHELRHVITRAVGHQEKIEPEFLAPYALKPGERILLCSDGLYNTLSLADMTQFLHNTPIAQVAEAMVSAGRDRATDNLTAVAYKSAGELPPLARPWWQLIGALVLFLIILGIGWQYLLAPLVRQAPENIEATATTEIVVIGESELTPTIVVLPTSTVASGLGANEPNPSHGEENTSAIEQPILTDTVVAPIFEPRRACLVAGVGENRSNPVWPQEVLGEEPCTVGSWPDGPIFALEQDPRTFPVGIHCGQYLSQRFRFYQIQQVDRDGIAGTVGWVYAPRVKFDNLSCWP